MKELIEKRNEYLNKQKQINVSIETSVSQYKEKKILELNEAVEAYKKHLINTFKADIDLYNERIKVLSDIIGEEMPSVEQTVEYMTKTEEPKIEDPIVEETKLEETIIDNYVVENIPSVELTDTNVVVEDATEKVEKIDEMINETAEEKFKEVLIQERPGMMTITNPTRE